MNSDAPTPRTEQEVRLVCFDHNDESEVVPADFARQLERELNEARAELERLKAKVLHMASIVQDAIIPEETVCKATANEQVWRIIRMNNERCRNALEGKGCSWIELAQP